MRMLAAIALCALGVSGCNRPATESTAVDHDAAVSNDNSVNHVTVDRDNTAVNERDQLENVKTPIDQNENQEDVDITANIRKQVVDTEMSVNAQNVKIITQDGKVTLRGPVKSDEEKQKIEAIATSVAGADKVDSQIEVEQQP